MPHQNLGRGHAVAIVQIIKKGAEIGDKHVGTAGAHRDDSSTLRLGGKGGQPSMS